MRRPGASRVALLAALLSALALAEAAAPTRLADVDVDADASSDAAKSDSAPPPNEALVQGLIQAGFPRARAEAALRAVGEDDCCEPQKRWLFEQTRGSGGTPADAAKTKLSESCHARESTDYDGYAVTWGSANIQATPEACCESCRAYEPKAPDFFPCNVWVFCPKEGGCFAPAAGEFGKGQCWLKYQEDPTNPHVNAFGAYSAAYRATHPAAPDKVDWVAGALVNKGETVSNGTWSSRSHWRR
jgi:hypothetical protein